MQPEKFSRENTESLRLDGLENGVMSARQEGVVMHVLIML